MLKKACSTRGEGWGRNKKGRPKKNRLQPLTGRGRGPRFPAGKKEQTEYKGTMKPRQINSAASPDQKREGKKKRNINARHHGRKRKCDYLSSL